MINKFIEVLPVIIALVFVLGFILSFARLDYISAKTESEESGEKFKWYKSIEMWIYVIKILVTGAVGVKMCEWILNKGFL